MDPWQIVALACGIVGALIGVIYLAGQHRDDKQDTRFDTDEEAFKEHVRDDVQAHERLRAVETDVSTLKVEVGKLRDMRHDIMEQVTHSLSSWYTDILKMIDKWKK